MRRINRACAVAVLFVAPLATAWARGQAAAPADAGKAGPATRPTDGDVDALAIQLGKERRSSLFEKPDDARQATEQLLRALRGLSDPQFDRLLDHLPDDDRGHGFDLCLTEMVRRGGRHWEEVLKAGHAALRAANAKSEDHFADRSRELLTLTALRRVEKKEDPLVILVEGKAKVEAKLGYLPQITANLTNLDPEKLPVSLEVGGDYRGASRHNKWRIQVTDAQGQPLPEREEFDMGGFVQHEVLQYAESIPMNLAIGSYVSIDKPGDYTLVVMFHPTVRIGTAPTVEGLVCCRSIPIRLVVEPIRVETTDAEQAQAAALILKLPATGAVRILGGAYNESVGEFMPKDSPAGQLKQMQWKAVPELIAAVNADKLNPTQRAWALGLLFGITDQRNPTEFPGVIGAFEYRHSGWVSLGGGPADGGSISRESVSAPEGRIDEKAQAEFAKGWKPWVEKEYIKVVKTDAAK